MTDLVLASRWATPDNRRREALRAAHAQDEAALLDLVEYHLHLKSRRAGDLSPHTLRLYHVAIRDFLRFTGPPEQPRHALQALTEEVIEAWLIHARRRPKQADSGRMRLGSVAAYLNGVRALYRALLWAGAVSVNPAAAVRAPRDPTPAHERKRALPSATVRALLALAAQHPDPTVAARDQAILVLGLTLGLRANEIVHVSVEDVSLPLGVLHVRVGKGGKERRVPIPGRATLVLQDWLQHREALRVRGKIMRRQTALITSFHHARFGDALSTGGLRTVVNGLFAQVGLPPDMWGVHTLRRTAGTRLYRATRDLHVVSDVLGHASVTTSAIYAKLDQDVRKEALDRAEDL